MTDLLSFVFPPVLVVSTVHHGSLQCAAVLLCMYVCV